MSNEAYQHDHTVNPHQKIVVNSYDWLQFRDEQDHYKSKNPITHASPGVGSNAQNSDIAEAPQVFHPSYQSLVNVPSESPRPDQTSGSNPAVGLLHNAEDKASGQEEEGSQYEIQYSVFRPLHAYPTKGLAYEQLRRKEEQEQRENFNHLVSDCIEAVETLGRELERIQTGSSGSYFVYGTRADESVPVGVFKPKDEEPYGPFSPKWTKWAHRTFFPCLFGRSCLIPNLGYICESAASLLDRRLETHLVPYTDTASIESFNFYDNRKKWVLGYNLQKKKQKKLGSFQLFLKEYINADEFFHKYPLPGMYSDVKHSFHRKSSGEDINHKPETTRNLTDETEPSKQINSSPISTESEENSEFEWTESTLSQFRLELEKLIILDYIMRNTDRGLDNWMVKLIKLPNNKWRLKLAAIDNGLSFPWKHPDEWRLYPYGWLYLPLQLLAKPFSEQMRSHFLPILTSTNWWEESYQEFLALFSRDQDFNVRMWKKQWAVLKGQAFNVVETLKDPRQGPLELVRRTRCQVIDEKMQVPCCPPPVSIFKNAIDEPIGSYSTSPMVLPSTPSTIPFHAHSQSNSNPVYYDSTLHPFANKTVIAERLQIVNSTPVFTWC
ncbi:Lsb6p [Saccharomyces cerevisiae YJM1419]|nr:Lsb6p [Saccharomyces cerevisiae YJM1419]AJR70086.1 Lsb6p [Saccharomyces cerevisiae YJM1434]AJR71400.1 Lsb6p [Saccharomyces cerevisiae YJM1447]AJV38664.1 Lsb6p [Saccharomyces cerevisiae YJM1273]CAI4539996.1 AVI_1a_G0028680.mRNA.1.CDS.1 [Saccharomyces cerevisiae]